MNSRRRCRSSRVEKKTEQMFCWGVMCCAVLCSVRITALNTFRASSCTYDMHLHNAAQEHNIAQHYTTQHNTKFTLITTLLLTIYTSFSSRNSTSQNRTSVNTFKTTSPLTICTSFSQCARTCTPLLIRRVACVVGDQRSELRRRAQPYFPFRLNHYIFHRGITVLRTCTDG